MNIGIMTFHWATNYGAVIQAYALQRYLSKSGYDVSIIDYVPETRRKTIRSCLRARRPSSILRNTCEYLKERRLQKFRSKYFRLSDRYSSYDELKKNPPPCHVLICGSDQIWHFAFTDRGEHKPTYAYFLDFGKPEVKRIAYAASFGCANYPQEVFARIAPRISVFNAVSVREQSGVQLALNAGVRQVSVVPDPTLLLSESDYNALSTGWDGLNNDNSFFYVLHHNQPVIDDIKRYFIKALSQNVIDSRAYTNSVMGIEQWLWEIKTAKTVVTNSFHGVVFAIIFKKTFITTLVEGEFSEMNDRVYTLLKSVGLENRILEQYDEDRIQSLLVEGKKIEWDVVEKRVCEMRRQGYSFLRHSNKTMPVISSAAEKSIQIVPRSGSSCVKAMFC